MRDKALTLKIFLLIVLNDIGDTVAQFFMKKGLNQIGIDNIGLGNIAEFVAKGASSPLVWLGIFVFILNFFVWIVILSRIDLSIAMPVGSLCYIFVPIVAMLFLHERFSLMRWAGIAVIVLGVHFVSQSTMRAKELKT